MVWSTASMRVIAPSQTSGRRFSPDELVWHLTLDQIESDTGQIFNKQMKPAGEAGNSTYVFDDANVLYSKLRPYLNKVVCPQEAGIATTELVPLSPQTDLVDREYLTHYMRSQAFVRFASATVAGVKMPRIIMEKFWSHEVPLPPLTEQRRIVEILDQADALRKQRAEADGRAARILPALFYQIFGDPATNPMGWPTRKIEQIAQVKGGKRLPKGEEYSPEPTRHRYIRGTDIYPGYIDETDLRYLYPEIQKKIKRYTVSEGDVVITIAGKIGVCAPIPASLEGANLTENAAKLVAERQDEYHPVFLSAQLNSSFVQGQIVALTGKVTIGKLALFRINTIDVVLPPIEQQRRFAEHAEKTRVALERATVASGHLELLFETLQHQAFSGELTAKWREAHMKELLQEMKHQAGILGITDKTVAETV